MPRPKVNGTLSPIRQPDSYSFDPTRGLTRTIGYECADPNGLFPIAAGFQALRYSFTHTPGGEKSKIIATASGPDSGQPEVTTDTWQLVGNEIQKDAKEHPTIIALELAHPGAIGYITRFVDLYFQNKTPTETFPGGTAPDSAIALAQLLIRGTTHYCLSQYVLKHTTNVSNTYAQNVADFNIDKVYTTEQLLSETQNGASWIYPLPARLAYKIDNLVANPTLTGYTWGWMKKASTETTSAGNRIEINTEYWLEQWNTSLLYQLAA